MERTLSIVKPDGVAKRVVGDVIARFEKQGLRIVGLRMRKLTKEDAREFYKVHKDRPFYDSLTSFMSEGPVVVMVIEGDGAIGRVREIMGATNPKDAAKGTIRADLAKGPDGEYNIERNIVHGSDSPESSAVEIAFFFSGNELI